MNLLLLLACAGGVKSEDAPLQAPPREGGEMEEKMAPAAGSAAPPPKPMAPARAEAPSDDRDAAAPEPGPVEEERSESAARSWFPESFLWMPSVATGPDGLATVDVQVPDTLTTWRVLALGHSRAGAQGGDVASFQSTLPAYVELTVPSSLVAGDRVEIPLLVVNQQASPLEAPLAVQVQGGAGGAGGAVRVGPQDSLLRMTTVSAGGPGELRILARLGEIDAVDRRIPVTPAGFPVSEVEAGTLGASADRVVEAVDGGHDGRVDVTVWPGALGYVIDELDRVAASSPTSLADHVYRHLLAGQARALGAPAESAALIRSVELRAWQGIVRASRSPDAWTAALVRAGLGSPSKDSPAAALAARLEQVIEDGQQPDGLWGLGGGSSIDRVLTHTAWCAWIGGEAPGLRTRASGAFARNAPRLTEPGMAAWALLSGAIEEPQRARLLAAVKAGIEVDEAGGSHLPGGGTRPDGMPLGSLDATAAAALVLADEPAIASELVTWLLRRRGEADAIGQILLLRAFTTVLGGEIPSATVIRLEADGQELARATLDPSQPHAPVSLHAALDGARHALRIASDPPVAGLAWSLERRAWVDRAPPRPGGLDLALTVPALSRNVEGPLQLSLSAPEDARVDLDLGLPAGVKADPVALDALVREGRIAGWWAEDGRLRLRGALASGGNFSASIPVRASFGGSLQAPPSRVVVQGRPQEPLLLAGARWQVR